jgi:hypothetical protein
MTAMVYKSKKVLKICNYGTVFELQRGHHWGEAGRLCRSEPLPLEMQNGQVSRGLKRYQDA